MLPTIPPTIEPEDALEQCLYWLETGQKTLEECIALHPQLAPLLRLAHPLMHLPTPTLSSLQIERMQSQILQKTSIKAAGFRTPIKIGIGMIAAGLLLFLMAILGIVLLQSPTTGSSSVNLVQQLVERVVSVTATSSITPTATSAHTSTASPTITFTPTETATSTASPMATFTPSLTPSNTATITPSPTLTSTATVEPSVTPSPSPTVVLAQHDEDELPVTVQITGNVEAIDESRGTLTVDGVTIVVNPVLWPTDLNTPITVEGALLNDGTIVAEDIGLADSPAPESTDCPENKCHPVLWILSQTYEIPYSTLAELHQQQLGVGEIARLLALADATNVTFEALRTQRQSGQSWAEIIATYPSIDVQNLSTGSVIRTDPPGHESPATPQRPPQTQSPNSEPVPSNNGNGNNNGANNAGGNENSNAGGNGNGNQGGGNENSNAGGNENGNQDGGNENSNAGGNGNGNQGGGNGK